MIDPRGYTVVEWTDYMNDTLSSYGPIPKLDDAARWKEWVYGILKVPQIADWGVPDPDFYDDWMAWADDFNKALPAQVQ